MKIFVLSTVSIGVDIINILKQHLKISGIIGLRPQKSCSNIAGYLHLGEFCKENLIPFFEVTSYSMSESADRKLLEQLDIDVLLVSGWQRLVPEWLIHHCKVAVIGSHGSPYGIAGGRGRSPQNWSLLMGKTDFFISIFKIDKGIDSGDVIAEKRFDISTWDDIRSTYNKVSWLTANMIVEAIRNKCLESNKLIPQTQEPRYFPMRTREDGELDWSRTNEEIYNFIRALTRPYPGAYSRIEASEIIIWRAKPFNVFSAQTYSPGTVVRVFQDQSFLVSTSSGFLQVDDYEIQPGSEFRLEPGMTLGSVCFRDQMKRIIERHMQKYPELVLADDVLNLAVKQL